MAEYYGDFSEDSTLYIPFNTFDSNDPSASVTITNLADADIKVHKDGSATEIVTDGATVAIDFDSITGNHLITIDTSVDAAYSTGSDYLVRIEGTTVDAATINAWVGSFSIENRHSAGALRPTTAGRTLDVTATGAAGIDWANVENQSTAVDLSGTDIQLADTTTTLTGHTAQTGDTYALANGSAGFVAIDTVVDAILVDTAEIGTAGAGLTNINLPNQTMDIVGNITGNLSGSVGSVTGGATSAAQTTAQNDLDIITGATGVNLLTATQASIDAIEVDTSTTLDIKINTIDTNVDAILSDTVILTSLLVEGTAITGTLSTTQCTTDLTEVTDDHYIGRLITFTSGVLAGQQSDITDYVGSTKLLTFTAMTEAPSNTDAFILT